MMRLSDPVERAVLEDRALERGVPFRVVLCRTVPIYGLGGDGFGSEEDFRGDGADGFFYGGDGHTEDGGGDSGGDDEGWT